MNRVMIVGCPGAGKSTFARKLRDRTGLPLYHLDLLWHKPDRTTVSREEFDARLGEILRKEEWIIDGNYQRTLEVRMKACNAVFLLDYPLELCLAGVEERVGRPHEDLPWTEETLDPEFRQWILDFPKNSLPEIYQLLEEYQNSKEIYIFRSREEADAWLSRSGTQGGFYVF